MKRYQTGEVMLVVMVVLLAVMWLGSGHMGMMGMGHGGGHADKSGQTEQKTKAEPPVPSAPKESPEHQH